MIFKIIIGIIFVVIISIQILHWVGYLYSRFSKNLEAQRNVIKTIAQMASKGKLPHIPKKVKEDDEFNGNQGYA